MRKFALVLLATVFVSVNVATADFDDSNSSGVIYWSPSSMSSTMVTVSPGDSVVLFAIVNHSGPNYSHLGLNGLYDASLNWMAVYGYNIGATWDADVVNGPSFNWNNSSGYWGLDAQGADPGLHYIHNELWNQTFGNWYFNGEISRTDSSAEFGLETSHSIIYGSGYYPYEWLHNNTVITKFEFTIASEINVAATGVDVYGNAYNDSQIGLTLDARNRKYSKELFQNTDPHLEPEFLSSWSGPWDGITLRLMLTNNVPDPGDFDNDGDVDTDDIDDLCTNLLGSGVSIPPGMEKYDLTGDDEIDQDDMDMLIHDLVEITGGDGTGTEYGDFDLDGDIDTTDLTILATNFGLGTTWAEGNANCDLVIDTTDLAIMATNFGFVASGAVPEPATMSLLALGSLALLRRRSR